MDLDGCNGNWWAGVHEWHRRCGYVEGPYRYPGQDPYLAFGMSRQEWLDRVVSPGVRAGVIGRYDWAYPGAAESWAELRGVGHRIHVTTARGAQLVDRPAEIEWTARMLAENSFVYDAITYTQNKAAVGADVYLEDDPHQFQRLTDRGAEVWLVTQLWNLHLDTDRRIPNVQAFTERVLAGEVRRDLVLAGGRRL
jgi:hypothetical protein